MWNLTGEGKMAKTNNLHIRIDPTIQNRADNVLKRLGMSIPDAVTVFLNQVGLEGGIPFMVRLPNQETEEKRGSHSTSCRRLEFCYGVELPDFSYDCNEACEIFCQMLQPDFKKKITAWYENAKSLAKNEEGTAWMEEYFSLKERDWDTFESLVEEAGFHLIPCYVGGAEAKGTISCGPVPPFVIGDFIFSARNSTKKVLEKHNPRFYHSLLNRLGGIFKNLTEKSVKIYEVFDWEAEKMMPNIYNPNDPNFMTKDDY
jgi:addiction module RelB/DinJ family antitoxin